MRQLHLVTTLLVLAVFSLLFGCNTAASPKTDREQDGLIGNVRSTLDEEKTLKNQFGQWIDDQARRRVGVEYNTKGHRTEEAHYQADGTLDGKTVYSYDEKDRLSEWVMYHADGTPTTKTVFTYDAKGNLIENVEYDVEDVASLASGTVRHKNRYTYDANGHVTETNYYEADGALITKEVFTYDARGNLTEQADYDGAGTLTKKMAYAYTDFDSVGNWRKKVYALQVTKFGKSYLEPKTVDYRTITYY